MNIKKTVKESFQPKEASFITNAFVMETKISEKKKARACYKDLQTLGSLPSHTAYYERWN